ncbi:MAG: phosphatidylserine decarboxylase [Patescibacteria group bacterium]|nr:phosphatidylserine decarboxylase [Patescibacteria group bacterium]
MSGDKLPVISLILLVLLGIILIFWKFIFLRNPKRNIPQAENIIVSPADGKVIAILEFKDKQVQLYKGDHRYLGLINTLTSDVSTDGYIISIFMSPMDVHHNRTPINGEVISVQHHDGKFLPVNSLEAGLVNEKSEIIIRGDTITLKMIQIAGFLARRVITHVKTGERVERGQVIGLINLGSQVTLIVPSNIQINIKQGDRVVAGETILAKINS